jgi:hypothetical protein
MSGGSVVRTFPKCSREDCLTRTPLVKRSTGEPLCARHGGQVWALRERSWS